MATSIVDHTFGPVLDEKLKELKTLTRSGTWWIEVLRYSADFIYLSPLLSSFIRESLVNHWHDLVEELAIAVVSRTAISGITILTSCRYHWQSLA